MYPLCLRSLRKSSILFRQKSTISLPTGEYSYQWLRDSCPGEECVHPSTRQKLHRTTDAVKDAFPKSIERSEHGVHIAWGSGHKSFYSTEYLKMHSSPHHLSAFHKDKSRQAWNLSTISSTTDAFNSYESLKEEKGMLKAITQLQQYGLTFVTGVPTQEASNETCELRKLAEMFGEIRNTFYGELWDVKNIRNSRNIAYTNLDLGLHMDLLYVVSAFVKRDVIYLRARYFENPPRYQFLHCLRNRVHGGTSMFVDALYAANKLQEDHPSHFHTLTTTPVSFHYINDGHHLHHDHPTIQLGRFPDQDGRYPIQHINYSPPFQAPLRVSTPSEFYDALMHFVEILEDPANKFEYTLQEGDTVIFDNRRVLHARTSFSEKEGTSEGVTDRWLKGCYIEADAMSDKARIMRGRVCAWFIQYFIVCCMCLVVRKSNYKGEVYPRKIDAESC